MQAHIDIELNPVNTRLGIRYEVRKRGTKTVLCRSSRPFIESARILAQYALNVPNLMLYAYHQNSQDWCLRGNVAALNKIVVAERQKREMRIEQRRVSVT